MKTLFATAVFVAMLVASANAESKRISTRGWFADEKCASARAAQGVFTATNPECARRCLKDGSKLVFIAEGPKAIFVVARSGDYAKHVGEYVEISGTVEDAGALNIESLTTIEKVGPSCGIRPKSR